MKAVSFDLWFTLIWEKHPEDEELYSKLRIESILETLKLRGYRASASVVSELLKSLGGARMILNSRELASLIAVSLDIEYSDELIEELAKAYEFSTDRFKPRENPEALTSLTSLRKMGVKIAVVSNTSFSARGVFALLRSVGLADYVDVVISSSDVGHVKPQKSIFQALVRSVGVEPTEIVHVGDSCIEDILGALSSGLHAIYYTGLLHLRRAEPSEICLNLVPTVVSLNDLPKVILDIE